MQQALNGISFGALLFILAAGLSLIFGMMDVVNLAHGAFYMLGAYFAYTISLMLGFWPALFIAPQADFRIWRQQLLRRFPLWRLAAGRRPVRHAGGPGGAGATGDRGGGEGLDPRGHGELKRSPRASQAPRAFGVAGR